MQNAQSVLVRALADPACFGHPVDDVSFIETHISTIVLAGQYAYKIKKPLALGFLDFSTLEKRLLFCNEELRLNRRLAPLIYLGVVPITGTVSRPRVEGTGTAIEYAVKMRRFSQEDMVDLLLEKERFPLTRMDELAGLVAGFHQALPVATAESAYGSLAAISKYVLQNFDQITGASDTESEDHAVAALRSWTVSELENRAGLFQKRKAEGFVRECHGDLHLGNVALIDDKLVIFDCIEFNPDLRWVDVMSEVSFTTMDLEARDRPAYASRFLNRYLELTGDYEGISVLRFYMTYRAMVRAKVRWILANEEGIDNATRLQAKEQALSYLRLAEKYAAERRPALLITHGLSGSGKTTVSQTVLEAIGAVRVRSDVERKRLFQPGPGGRTRSGIGEGLYNAASGDRTYARLAELASRILRAGWPVIVDAAFLEKNRRDLFHDLAKRNNARFLILNFQGAETALKARVRERSRKGTDASDADLAVLEHQLKTYQPPTSAEEAYALTIDTDRLSGDEAARLVKDRLA
jgi:uncharacterized protein